MMFTSQKEVAKEMIAFANTKGGVILFGVEDKTGVIKGLSYDEIQQTSRELGNAAQELVKPTIYIETEVVKVEGKHVLVCSIEEGRNKPYKNLQGEIWVKQGADKRRITENAEILSLFQSSGNYHPEEDPEKGTTVDDLEMADLRDFFRRVYGREIEDFDQPLESMLKSLGILTAEGEVTRAGMLFFGRDPQHFEHSVVLKAVAFQGNDIGDTNYLDSRDITGTLPRMFKEGMAFLKSYLRHEQRGQNFNSTGILEISEVALEELLQNALVHFDLLNHAAIRLLIFSNRVEIINPGCLYGGLRVEDIKLGVSRQRNPLMAELAARTMIYRGLGSGIIRVMRENTPIVFDNQESADQFKVTVWRTAQKGKVTTQRGKNTTQKNEVSTQKGVLTTQKRPESTQKKENSTQKKILEYLRVHPQATRLEVSKALGDITEDGVKYAIARLQEKGLLKRVGGRKQGEWIVKDKND
jgi:ATP-dependent DNA helicase RecG